MLSHSLTEARLQFLSLFSKTTNKQTEKPAQPGLFTPRTRAESGQGPTSRKFLSRKWTERLLCNF